MRSWSRRILLGISLFAAHWGVPSADRFGSLAEAEQERNERAAVALAARHDADARATAALLLFTRHPDRALELIGQATAMAPQRADLAFLHLRICETHDNCDAQPLEIRIRQVDGGNGAVYLGSMARAGRVGDAQAMQAALAGMAQTGRVDLYLTPLMARLGRQLVEVEFAPDRAVETVAGLLASFAIPPFRYVVEACRGDALQSEGRRDACRQVADAMLRGDTLIVESVGADLAQGIWPEAHAKWREADAVRRRRDEVTASARQVDAWRLAHPDRYLGLAGQHASEQDLMDAVLVESGKDPATAD